MEVEQNIGNENISIQEGLGNKQDSVSDTEASVEMGKWSGVLFKEEQSKGCHEILSVCIVLRRGVWTGFGESQRLRHAREEHKGMERKFNGTWQMQKTRAMLRDGGVITIIVDDAVVMNLRWMNGLGDPGGGQIEATVHSYQYTV